MKNSFSPKIYFLGFVFLTFSILGISMSYLIITKYELNAAYFDEDNLLLAASLNSISTQINTFKQEAVYVAQQLVDHNVSEEHIPHVLATLTTDNAKYTVLDEQRLVTFDHLAPESFKKHTIEKLIYTVHGQSYLVLTVPLMVDDGHKGLLVATYPNFIQSFSKIKDDIQIFHHCQQLTVRELTPLGEGLNTRADNYWLKVAAALRGSLHICFMVMGVFTLVFIMILKNIVRENAPQKSEIAQLYRQNKAISQMTSQLHRSYLETIQALVTVLEQKDPHTRGHSLRVSNLAVAIGRELGLCPTDLEQLHLAGLLHDVGKIAIPESILNKPGPLSKDEYCLIKQHPIKSQEIIEGISILKPISTIVRHHHERVDGLGYPDGLSHDTTLLLTRILTVADAWDAMTSHRPYRPKLTIQESMVRLTANRGTQFCPEVVDGFFRHLHKTKGYVIDPTQHR